MTPAWRTPRTSRRSLAALSRVTAAVRGDLEQNERAETQKEKVG